MYCQLGIAGRARGQQQPLGAQAFDFLAMRYRVLDIDRMYRKVERRKALRRRADDDIDTCVADDGGDLCVLHVRRQQHDAMGQSIEIDQGERRFKLRVDGNQH